MEISTKTGDTNTPLPANENKQQVAFILGIYNRSGTNFLSNLICQHPECEQAHIKEDFLLLSGKDFQSSFEKINSLWATIGVQKNIGLEEFFLKSIGDGLMLFLKGLKNTISLKVTDQFIWVPKSRKDAKYMVTKTPDAYNIDYFPKIFPGEKLIIIVRDGRTLIESMTNSFEIGFEKATRRWNASAGKIADFKKNTDSAKYLLLKYEDLYKNTRAEMTKVLEYLELDTEKYDFEKAINAPVVGSSEFKRGDGAVHWFPVKKTEDFKPLERAANWSRKQHERFNWLAKDGLIKLGYDPKIFEGQKLFWICWNRIKDVQYKITKSYRHLRKKFFKKKITKSKKESIA